VVPSSLGRIATVPLGNQLRMLEEGEFRFDDAENQRFSFRQPGGLMFPMIA
jgi:hypothetical protein